MIDDLVINFCFFGNFSSMKDITRECNPMVDLSKFTSKKMILSGVVALRFIWLEGWKSGRIENILIFLIFVWLRLKKWKDEKNKFV